MSDALGASGDRALVVLALACLVAVVVLAARFRPAIRSRTVADTGLSPGTYLLTSGGCSTCERARATLHRRGVAYEELTWQASPDVFERLGIDAVPSVLAVDESGSGRWWRGGVPRRLPG